MKTIFFSIVSLLLLSSAAVAESISFTLRPYSSDFQWNGYITFHVGASEGSLFTVNWGDGEITQCTGEFFNNPHQSGNTPGLLEHTYSNPNNSYTVTISAGGECAFYGLRVNGKAINSLNVTAAPHLEGLELSGGFGSFSSLTTLNLTQNPYLRYLLCYELGLTSLNVSQNPRLYELLCSGNKFSSLDLSNNPALELLVCSGTSWTEYPTADGAESRLTSLNVSNCTALRYVSCINNSLSWANLYAIVQRLTANGIGPGGANFGDQYLPTTHVSIGVPIAIEPVFNGNVTVVSVSKVSDNYAAATSSNYNYSNGTLTFLAPYTYGGTTQRTGYDYRVTLRNPTVSEDASVHAFYEVLPAADVATPVITTQPQSATYTVAATSANWLSVSASRSDNGTLSYQWYQNTTNSNTGGTLISGATESSYMPIVLGGGAGTYYYYVKVTNTNNNVTGIKTATVTSNVATITVNAATPTNAATPVITTHPQSATYSVGGTATALSVVASKSDGGTLSYRWYKNTSNSTTGGTSISGATNSTYTPPTTTAGTFYYYVAVTNTNNNATVTKTATTTSNVAVITVSALTSAATPVFTAHPQDASYSVGATATVLSVTAISPDGGTLTYQWYSSPSNETNSYGYLTEGRSIAGATSITYTPSTTSTGTLYYYCVVTNRNNNATGTKTAQEKSNVAAVTVNTLVNAAAPTISAQPQSATYSVNGTATALSVTATLSDNGALSYQWYANGTNDNTSGTAIPGATGTTYTPSTTTAGTTYYYVVVTNTKNDATGNKVATVTSDVATIAVNEIALVNAAPPVIYTQPEGATVSVGGDVPLYVSVGYLSDGGTISYQWYSNATNSNTGGTVVGSNSSNYYPTTDTEGTTYYYVVVTNTKNDATGAKTATATSNTAAVTVNALVNAKAPVITQQPQGATYTHGEQITPLTVMAISTDEGELYYIWYWNSTNSTTGGYPVNQGVTCHPTGDMGTCYYYVVVTNVNNSATGEKTATETSNIAAITVNAPTYAAQPVINAHPQGATYSAGATPAPLSVTATVDDGGTLSYRWYSDYRDITYDGTLVGTGETFTPPTLAEGTRYYFVSVTNTNNSATGGKTASTTSNTAAITVNNLTNAAVPYFTQYPQGTNYTQGDNANPLTANAAIAGNGTVSYEWFVNTVYSSTGGTAVGTGNSYTPSTDMAGTFYYYVVATNTDNNATGEKTASTTSYPVEIRVSAPVVAQPPVIYSHPQSNSYTQDESPRSLTVSASATDDGILSYQWFSNTTNSTSGGNVAGTGNSFTPATSNIGTTYYYVVVTNTKQGNNGTTTAADTSYTANITVNAKGLVNAAQPAITQQPQNGYYTVGDTPNPLYVNALTADDGNISYQWFQCNSYSNAGGTTVGATQQLLPPTSTAGTYYFYAVVTNNNNNASGNKIATTTSAPVVVTVVAPTNPGGGNNPGGNDNGGNNGAGNKTLDDQRITVFPNPVTDGILFVKGTQTNDIIEIFSITGKHVGSFIAAGSTTSIQLNHLPKGIYFVKTKQYSNKILVY